MNWELIRHHPGGDVLLFFSCLLRRLHPSSSLYPTFPPPTCAVAPPPKFSTRSRNPINPMPAHSFWDHSHLSSIFSDFFYPQVLNGCNCYTHSFWTPAPPSADVICEWHLCLFSPPPPPISRVALNSPASVISVICSAAGFADVFATSHAFTNFAHRIEESTAFLGA